MSRVYYEALGIFGVEALGVSGLRAQGFWVYSIVKGGTL